MPKKISIMLEGQEMAELYLNEENLQELLDVIKPKTTQAPLIVYFKNDLVRVFFNPRKIKKVTVEDNPDPISETLWRTY